MRGSDGSVKGSSSKGEFKASGLGDICRVTTNKRQHSLVSETMGRLDSIARTEEKSQNVQGAQTTIKCRSFVHGYREVTK